MVITEISIIHHVAIVLLLLWLLNAFGHGRPIFYFLSLLYLVQVNERYVMRLSRKLQFEQRRQANQRRVLMESETVRWLNHAIEKIWPICMEEIVSQKIFLPIIPWFLDKYKPWTIKKAAMEHLYLGRKPPIFTDMRVLHESSDDDHLVLELGLNFLTADDMSAILAAKLRQRLGFGIVTKMHLTSMHVEGKVLVGVKFLRDWPYIGRLRICFAEPPYFQMTVKPLFNHGIDVTEVPGIAGWLDNLLAVAFEQTLVQPNMLVVDMEKFVSQQQSPQKENWFSILVKEPIAYARVEVIEGSNMQPSDLNGLADPYVKGQLGPYRFKTNIQRKTLAPKWQEEFKIPICSWESDNVLTIEVHDKDPFVKKDDKLGVCSVDISHLRDGQRHDMWVPLESVKMGRMHLAITVDQVDSKGVSTPAKDEKLGGEHIPYPPESESAEKESGSTGSSKKSRKFADRFEPIDIEGQKQTGIWIHHPGSDISQRWEHRKSSIRRSGTIIEREGDNVVNKTASPKGSQQHDGSCDEVEGSETSHRHNIFKTGLQMINNVFHRSQKKEDISASSKEPVRLEPVRSGHINVKAVDARRIGIKLMVEENVSEHPNAKAAATDVGGEESGLDSTKEPVKGMPKSALKQGGESTHDMMHALSRKESKNFSRTSEEEIKDRGIDDNDSESSDEESLLEGVPITNSESTNYGDNDTMNIKEQALVDAHGPPPAVSCSEPPSVQVDDTCPCGDDGEAAVKNARDPSPSEESRLQKLKQ